MAISDFFHKFCAFQTKASKTFQLTHCAKTDLCNISISKRNQTPKNFHIFVI